MAKKQDATNINYSVQVTDAKSFEKMLNSPSLRRLLRGVVSKATKNIYRVKPKVWRQWSQKAQEVFNRVYDFNMDNQKLVTHPKQEAMKPSYWKTIAWNTAWIAADAVDNKLPDVVG